MLSRGGSKYPLLTGGRVRRKRGGASVHLTYEDQKFVCHPEDVGVTPLPSPPDLPTTSDSTVVENLKKMLEENSASTEASSEIASEEVTPDVNEQQQDGGGRRRKKTKKVTTKAKPKTKKTKPKRKKSGGTSGCALKVEGGAKKKKVVKKEKKEKKVVKKSRKGLYMEYLDKKYSKDQLMKICKKLGIKITVRKNGNIKPIKKETLIKKITVLKFNK